MCMCSTGPWSRRPVAALALPSPALLLLVTSSPAQLWALPLGAPPRALAGLRPTPLPAKVHGGAVRAASYDPRAGTLVLAGEATAAASGGSSTAAVGVSAWRVAAAAAAGAAKAPATSLLGSFVGTVGGRGAAAGAWSRGRWVLSVSSLGEHAALCCPPAGGLLLLALPGCGRVDAGERFGGRGLPAASGPQLQPSLASAASAALSASWWGGSEALLALSDVRGGVGLAALPGWADALGLGLAGEQPPRFKQGALVAAKPGGRGPAGLLVLEPQPLPPPPAEQPQQQAPGRGKGRGRDAAAAAPPPPPPPGYRLVLLAERTPAQMLRASAGRGWCALYQGLGALVYVRRQQWDAALALAARAGLPADAVRVARWSGRPADGANIADNLATMEDRRWVVVECATRLAPDAEAQRALIEYGLRETERRAAPPGVAAAAAVEQDAGEAEAARCPAGEEAWWWAWRLVLLRQRDRLDVLLAAQGGSFDPSAFSSFRDLPLLSAAASWAALGAVGPLTALGRAYPAGLSGPPLLAVLGRLPESLKPRAYASLLPRADAEDAATRAAAPPRSPDWVEDPTLLALLARDLPAATAAAASARAAARAADTAAASAAHAEPGSSGLGSELDRDLAVELDPEATDAALRCLAPRPRLSAAAVSDWFAERALELDEGAGQLQSSLALLELGWERGARSARVAELLAAARALAGLVGTAQPRGRPQAASSASAVSERPWRLRLRDFCDLPLRDQLRLLLAGGREETLEDDLEGRVLPFVRGLGSRPGDLAPVLAGLLADETARRPRWAAALVAAEAGRLRLFGSAAELAQAVHDAVLSCPHTDEWSDLTAAVEAAQRALAADAAGGEAGGPEGDESPAAADAIAAGDVGRRLYRLRGLLSGGALLAARGLAMRPSRLAECAGSEAEAAGVLRRLLGRVQRSSPSMAAPAWCSLWSDLAQLRAAAFTCLTPQQVLSELLRVMLHCGQLELADDFLRRGPPGGEVVLEPAAAESLVASAAAELLAAATDPWDDSAELAAAVLGLAAAPDAPPAAPLVRLLAALRSLPDWGVGPEVLLPAKVLQMHDRFDVVRMILEREEEREEAVAAGGGVAAAAAAVVRGTAGSKGAPRTRGSRRRAAMRAAGAAAAAAAAGGRAAAALAGGLLAVAGRVAPVAGLVAGAVAGAVSAAAEGADGAAAVLYDAGFASPGPSSVPPYRQLGRLLELAELLGLATAQDELRVKELAGRAALRAGDVVLAAQLALGLVAAGHVPAWSLCADLGCCRRLSDDVVRQKLLSYALLHCPPARMPVLLEELRAAERRALLAAECFAHCAAALAPTPGPGAGAERLSLLGTPLGALLVRVRPLAAVADGTRESAAAAAALRAEEALAAAADGRAVRVAVPDVDAAAFSGGDTAYRRQAILQQAAQAGAEEAAAPGASPRAASLLESARSLAAAYGVEGWELEAAYVVALATTAPAVTPELRAAVASASRPPLSRPGPLLARLAAAYGSLPPASGPHLALLLGLLADCLAGMAQDAAAAPSPSSAALAGAAAPALSKLRDLIDKAGPALKGLALAAVLAPLLGALTAPLGAPLTVAAALGSAGEEAEAALAAAAAAMFAYVKPATLPQASKLAAALHKLWGPLAKRTASGGAADAAPRFPGLAAALDALPTHLPSLCLAVKAIAAKLPPGAAGGDGAPLPPPPPRDMAAAWGHASDAVSRLPAGALAGWLGFLLLPGGRCPLDPRVTGGPLQPCIAPPELRLMILEACLPRLDDAPPTPNDKQPAQAPPATAAAAACVDPALLQRLSALRRWLRLAGAVRQQCEAAGLAQEQVDSLEEAVLKEGQSGDPFALSAVRSALGALAARGRPVAALGEVAAQAVEVLGADAAALVTAALEDSVRAALSHILTDAGVAEAAGGATSSDVDGVAHLRRVLLCLDTPAAEAEAEAAHENGDGGAVVALPALRDGVWSVLQRFNGSGPEPGTSSVSSEAPVAALERADPAAAGRLAELLSSLGAELWHGWSGGGASARGDQARRLLTARTRALLATLPAVGPDLAAAVHADDLASRAAANALFARLLATARAHDGGSDSGSGGAAVAAPLSRAAGLLLWRLLAEVWQDGAVWPVEEEAAGGDEVAQGEGPAANGDVAEAEAAAAGALPSPAHVSPLRRSWSALASELLRGAHLLDVVRLLDPPASSPALAPLAEGDVAQLMQQAADAAATPSDSDLDPSASGLPNPASAASWMLGLASPYAPQRQAVVAQLEAWGAQPQPRLSFAVTAAAADGSSAAAAEVQVAVLLLSYLVASGDAARLAVPTAAASAHGGARADGSGGAVHPLLPLLLQRVPSSPAEARAAGAAAAAAGCAGPSLIASLVEARLTGLGAALAARRLKLHPSLAAAGGAGALLGRYLRAVAEATAQLAAEAERADRESDGDDAGWLADGSLLGGWPGAVAGLWRGQAERCRRAMRLLAGDAAGQGHG
ncbi:hypothetical protein GPECTOR_55g306 [Gonium pectorale]|uniref:Sec39 domain-containing protein n=1 Tax=Gonium pectorale TaxID=33097 RepID=A0A150G7S7_GONPE|nr:hypothetical protein GPECTOR_55g306 [Gonium pectorale]|eukprot:KXZ45400.1 hypothetical protein GPECTOR_55g306 [Gonium pectorale]